MYGDWLCIRLATSPAKARTNANFVVKKLCLVPGTDYQYVRAVNLVTVDGDWLRVLLVKGPGKARTNAQNVVKKLCLVIPGTDYHDVQAVVESSGWNRKSIIKME